ncbi:MAG TPA: diguanylate cyclase, partial [Polyangiaceae bacterium]|nr:diguanylate cyclase [Polyangiaceae bacterium]
VLRTNPALERLLGRSAAVLRALDFWSITHPDDVAGDVESREELLAGERSTTTRIKRFRHGAGHYVWVRLSAAVIRDRYGRAQGTVAVIEDVTAQRAAEEAIAHQARIYETIARNIPGGGVLLFDRDMRYLAADGADLLASLGFEKAQLEGRTLDEVAAPENLERIKRLYEQVLGGKSVELESSRHGHMLRTRFAPVLEGQAVTGGIALIQDVTEQHEQSQHLERTRQLFEATIASVRDGVVVLDGQNQALYANRAYAELFGFEPEKLVGLTRADFLRHVETLVDDPAACRAAIERPAPGADGAAVELTLVRPKLRHVRRTITPLVLPDGPGHVVVWHDISVERELLAERERQALTDALTGLPNRRAVELELTKAFARAERGGGPLCVALLDVDHFKRVNDTFGHATGDAVLKRVASALDEAKRLTDTIGRWGGEEFIAVLPVPLDGGATFCERVRRRIASLTHEGVGRVTISIGVAELAPKETPEALLGRADERLYAAKSKGRDRVEA